MVRHHDYLFLLIDLIIIVVLFILYWCTYCDLNYYFAFSICNRW